LLKFKRMFSVQDAAIAGGFAFAAATSRLLLRRTLSRLQILFFWFMAVALEPTLAAQTRGHLGFAGMALDAAASTLAIIAVKWRLEGVPRLVSRLWK
jgi:hypothetical protein